MDDLHSLRLWLHDRPPLGASLWSGRQPSATRTRVPRRPTWQHLHGLLCWAHSWSPCLGCAGGHCWKAVGIQPDCPVLQLLRSPSRRAFGLLQHSRLDSICRLRCRRQHPYRHDYLPRIPSPEQTLAPTNSFHLPANRRRYLQWHRLCLHPIPLLRQCRRWPPSEVMPPSTRRDTLLHESQ